MDDEIKPTPRNKLLGLLADGLRGGLDFATNDGKNKPMKLLSEILGVPAVANVTDKLSYGENLTTGKGFATRLKPDVFDAAMAVAPLTSPTLKLAGLLREGAGMLKGGQAMQSMSKASPMADRGAIFTSANGKVPQELLDKRLKGFGNLPESDLYDAAGGLRSDMQKNIYKLDDGNYLGIQSPFWKSKDKPMSSALSFSSSSAFLIAWSRRYCSWSISS